jgi:glycerophosphoryl diester phosphodiesterase
MMKTLPTLSLLFVLTMAISETRATSMCITHAGDAERELENSMSSFRSSFSRGSDGMEIDIRHTRDGVAIVMHDGTLAKVGRSKEGKSCPLDQKISSLHSELIRSECELSNGENIPTLKEVFEQFSDKSSNLLLDIKDKPSTVTVRLVNQYAKSSPLKIVALVKIASDLLPPFTLRARFRVPTLLTNSGFTPVLNMVYDGVDVANISDSQIKRLLKRHKLISLYNANDEEALKRAVALKVPLITTDNLEECLRQKD